MKNKKTDQPDRDLIRDAKRYRFLREQKIVSGVEVFQERRVNVEVQDWGKNLGFRGGAWSSTKVNGEQMDKEIDKAIRRASRKRTTNP